MIDPLLRLQVRANDRMDWCMKLFDEISESKAPAVDIARDPGVRDWSQSFALRILKKHYGHKATRKRLDVNGCGGGWNIRSLSSKSMMRVRR